MLHPYLTNSPKPPSTSVEDLKRRVALISRATTLKMPLLTRKNERNQYNLVHDESEQRENQLPTTEALAPNKTTWCRETVLAVLGVAIAALLCGYLVGRYSLNHRVENELEGLMALKLDQRNID